MQVVSEWYRKQKGLKQLELIKENIIKKKKLRESYMNLGAFVCFVVLFLTVAVLQKYPTIAFQVENSVIEHTFTIPSGLVDLNNDIYFDLSTPQDIYKWLRLAIIEPVFKVAGMQSFCG